MTLPDPVARLNSALEGRYHIESELGEGGMATVYLAADLKHERKVALKVLKPELAAVVGAERFLAEIKTTANLQHPHILPLFDSGEADSFLFYVMPYVEGETLRARLERERQLPVEEAVRIASDVAEALHAAHEQGVIHRDIKPANILLSKGRPLVADFGIALAVSAAGGGRLTETGLSMGTPYYMSPEQASADREQGASSDVYSLGCVLYEMLVGEPPYTGGSAQAVLAKILTGDAPAPARARSSIPGNVDAAIRKALERLPADRFVSAQSFARALSDKEFRHGHIAVVRGASREWWREAAMGLGVVSVGLFIALLKMSTGSVPMDEPLRLTLELPAGQEFIGPGVARGMAISDDGSVFVYTGSSAAGDYQLWVRRRDALSASPIPDTRLANSPDIAPDNSEVAFVLRGRLHAVSVQGGPLRSLSGDRVEGRRGIEWGADGFVYYTNADGGVSRVTQVGGEPEVVIAAGEGEAFGHPHLLPDGETLLLSRLDVSSGSVSEMTLVDVRSGARTGLGLVGAAAVYVPTGYLVFQDGEGLSAVPFDLDALEANGRESFLIAGVASFTLSQTGTLIHRSAIELSATPVWVDRNGIVEPIDADWSITNPEDRESIALSPDGRQVAVSVTPPGGVTDVWIRTLDASGALRRLTIEGERNYRPAWAPDSRGLAFISVIPEGRWGMSMPVDGSAPAVPLVRSDDAVDEVVFSHDGDWVIYRVGIGTVDRDIYAISTADASTVIPVVTTPTANDRSPALSPNDSWLAYVSDESGRNEVWVVPFRGPGTRRQVSVNGGHEPVWAHNGRELFYRNAADELVRVEVTTGSTFTHGTQSVLFSVADFQDDPNHVVYDIAPDDERFLMLERRPGGGSIVWVENWLTELDREAAM
jgi:serine/threonine-protein kinase